jgi:SAM-dependent methyltransferase
MPDTIPFDPHRFAPAAEHYLAGRPPYPAGLIARIAQLTGLAPTHRVLDLGCGPGQIGRAFAPLAGEVIGIDPEPNMLRIAADLSAGIRNISWREGSSYDLSPDLGPCHLVCIGRAFHWMDRADTLRRLDAIVAPGGAVALLSDSAVKLPDNAWRTPYREILDRYADGASARARWRSPDWIRNEAFLLGSAFPHLEEIAVYERHAIDIETLIARALSMSSTSPSRLGERTGAMVEELRAALAPAGVTHEVVKGTALIAWRAGA